MRHAAGPSGWLYNAQIAVDASHKLIVAFDLTNQGNDQQQLHAMAVQGKAAVAADTITVLPIAAIRAANRGRAASRWDHGHRAARRNGQSQGKQTSAVTSSATDRESDSWRCPAGETLSLTRPRTRRKKKEYTSKASALAPPAAVYEGGAAG